jgi:hypothetical protein
MCHTLYIVMSTADFFFSLCVLRFILTCSFGMLSTIRFVICFILLCPPVCVFVYPIHPMFYFVLSIRSAFPHPMCHMYMLMSTADLLFFHVICFTLCCPCGLLSSSDLLSALYCYVHPKCVFLSCVSYVLFCIVHSDCFSPSDLSYALFCHIHL